MQLQAVQAFAENGSKLAGVDLAHWAINRRLGSEINVFDWAACQWGYLRSELAMAFTRIYEAVEMEVSMHSAIHNRLLQVLLGYLMSFASM